MRNSWSVGTAASEREQLAVVRASLQLRCVQAIHSLLPMSGALFVVGALLWAQAPALPLLAWLLSCFTATLVAAVDCSLMVKRIETASADGLAGFNLRFTLTTLLNTVAMGSGVWWLAAANTPEVGFFVTLCLCFYAIGQVINGFSHASSFLIGLLANLGQALVHWLIRGGSGFAIAFMLAGIAYLLYVFMRQNAKTFSDNVRMRFQNLDLVEAVSEEKKAVERALAEAKAASLAKSRFLAAAAHDLRQPLHALSLWTGLLRESVTDKVALQRVEKVSLSVESLNKLFTGLLDLSRLDGGTVIAERRDVRLQEIFDALANDARDQVQAQGIAWHIDATQTCVHSDPIWLERILRNLLDNAVKYTSHGSISVSCEESADRVRISIQDTGIGIAPADQRHIFEEYFQVHNPARDRSHGVGLGLAIVKRACDLLGHPITVHSALGVGSNFSLTLPRGSGTVAPALDVGPTDAGSSQGLDGMVVVVVEDDHDVAQATEALLREWHCIPVCCASAAQALTMLSAMQLMPHAVIADFRLADHASGSDAIASLRRKFGSLPAALVSGEVNAAELPAQSVWDYPVLQKPLSAAALRGLLHSFQQTQ